MVQRALTPGGKGGKRRANAPHNLVVSYIPQPALLTWRVAGVGWWRKGGAVRRSHGMTPAGSTARLIPARRKLILSWRDPLIVMEGGRARQISILLSTYRGTTARIFARTAAWPKRRRGRVARKKTGAALYALCSGGTKPAPACRCCLMPAHKAQHREHVSRLGRTRARGDAWRMLPRPPQN